MKLFSFFKKEKVLRCACCGEEMESPAYTKYVGKKEYHFCSRSCKKEFRNSGKGKQRYTCPTCKLKGF